MHNQDNREHDLLDSDDYYQFEGGMTLPQLSMFLAMSARLFITMTILGPENPVIRTLWKKRLAELCGPVSSIPNGSAVLCATAIKGAFEIAATVDYMFAFSATTGAVRDHHFDAVYQAFIVDDTVRRVYGRTIIRRSVERNG